MTAVLRLAGALALVSLLSACVAYAPPPPPVVRAPVYSAPPPYYGRAPQPQVQQPPPQYAQYGYVRSVEHLQAQPATSGGGALAGAIVGAVIGRQFGGGSGGRAAGTAIGAVGGAIVGNEIERSQQGARSFVRVVVDLERGGALVFSVPDDGGLRPGERVRVENNQIVRL